MKFRGPLFFSFLLVGLIVAAFYQPYDQSEKESVLLQTIISGLNRYHYEPQTLDDAFSEKVYDLYLDRMDPGRRWLTQEDLAQLKPFRQQLDDQANAGTYAFFDLSVELMQAGIEKSQAYYREILAEPFDFTIDETFQMDGEKRPFAANDADLKEAWRKILKYETLTRLNEKLEKQQKQTEKAEAAETDNPEEKVEKKEDSLIGKSFDELEAMAREDVLEVFDDWYKRLNRRKRSDHINTYLNVITNVFDPHTGYYEPIEKQNFDISMSGKLEGIGARLQTDGDYTKVIRVIVGGPAWKQGDLQENDKITKVAQANEEPVDVTGWEINDVVQLIRGEKGSEVTLTVKKVDGTTEDITIVRDVVVLEEGFAKSLLLDTPGEEKVGYIRLPRFYDDFSDDNGRSCAEDVAKEIEKLKEEKVDGIILDLRNNGGGSLRDVITMTGLFFEEGPVVQVKARGRQASVYRDVDSRVQWDGPLIVMVNQFSASASEILAAALQDYDRALIVGSGATFGKGTVQRFIDLDRSVPGHNEMKPLGAIKLTTQKFYRVDGGSTQLRGVTPDIVFPDTYSYIETGEAENDYPMQWTEIDAVDYYQNVYEIGDRKKLQKKSEARMKDNEVFQKIEEYALKLKDQRENSMYSLNLKNYQEEQKRMKEELDAYEANFEAQVIEEVQNLPVDMPRVEKDEGSIARNDEWIKNIRKDVYLAETLHIMDDILK
jgi:carboxyl-terminal processing protease